MEGFYTLVGFQLLMTLVCVALVIISLRARASSLNKMLLALALAATVDNAAYVMELMANNLTEALCAVRVQYLSVPYVVTLLMLFTCRYCRVKVREWALSITVFIALLSSVCVFAYPYIKIFYSNAEYVGIRMAHLAVERAPLYYVYMTSIIVQMAYCIITLIRSALAEQSEIRRHNCRLLTIGATIGIVPYIMGLFGVFGHYNAVSAAIACGSVFVIVGTLSNHMLDTAETAEQAVLYDLSDPIIALNRAHNFVYANAAAKKLFPILADIKEGGLVITLPSDGYYETDGKAYIVDTSEILEDKGAGRKSFLVGYRVLFIDVSQEKARSALARAMEIRSLSNQAMKAFKVAIETFCSDDDESKVKLNNVLERLEALTGQKA